MEPVPSLQDVIFMVKTAKNGGQGRKVRSIFFWNFFFEINVKFDGESNGTGPEARRRQLRAQNLKKPTERVEKLDFFFVKFFFEIDAKFDVDFKNTCFESTPSWKKNDKMMW